MQLLRRLYELKCFLHFPIPKFIITEPNAIIIIPIHIFSKLTAIFRAINIHHNHSLILSSYNQPCSITLLTKNHPNEFLAYTAPASLDQQRMTRKRGCC